MCGSNFRIDFLMCQKTMVHDRNKKIKPLKTLRFQGFLAQREGFEPSCDCSQTDFEPRNNRGF